MNDLFGTESWWVVIVKALLIFVFLLLITLWNIWFERKIVARMQHRVGPMRWGPFGLLQALGDGMKLAFKEEIFPKAADKVVYYIAPIIVAVPSFLAWAVIPFGPDVKIPFTDTTTPLQLTDLPVAVLYVLAVASIGIYGIVLAGWSSGSIYALLGGLRSSAQMISYEIAMSLSLIPVFMYAHSMSTSAIVNAQSNVWYCFPLIPSFVIYVIAMVGETNRAPFDLPEAEGELVGGFHTEYSSFKFAMFFLAEYINMVTVSALATTMFLGGWRAPFGIGTIWHGANHGFWPVLWFVGKLLSFIFMYIWLRGTLPRLRYDQFMRFGWKILIPFALGWVFVASIMRKLADEGKLANIRGVLLVVIVVLLIALVLTFLIPEKREPEPEPAEFDAFAGGYPVPPMPAPGTLPGGAADPHYVPSPDQTVDAEVRS